MQLQSFQDPLLVEVIAQAVALATAQVVAKAAAQEDAEEDVMDIVITSVRTIVAISVEGDVMVNVVAAALGLAQNSAAVIVTLHAQGHVISSAKVIALPIVIMDVLDVLVVV